MSRTSELWASKLDSILCQLEDKSLTPEEFCEEAKGLGLSSWDIVTYLGNSRQNEE